MHIAAVIAVTGRFFMHIATAVAVTGRFFMHIAAPVAVTSRFFMHIAVAIAATGRLFMHTAVAVAATSCFFMHIAAVVVATDCFFILIHLFISFSSYPKRAFSKLISLSMFVVHTQVKIYLIFSSVFPLKSLSIPLEGIELPLIKLSGTLTLFFPFILFKIYNNNSDGTFWPTQVLRAAVKDPLTGKMHAMYQEEWQMLVDWENEMQQNQHVVTDIFEIFMVIFFSILAI
jgi:hypothetical protein